MSTEATTQGQEVVECNLCRGLVSFYCRRCKVQLCDSCVPVHLRMASENGHDVVDFTRKDFEDSCWCDSHPESKCSAYCKTCDVPICILCVSIKHRFHELSELSEKIKELLKCIAWENDRLQSFRQDLKAIQKHTTERLSSLSSFYQQEKDFVTARGDEWHNQVNACVRKLHKELEDLEKENEDILRTQKKEFEEIIELLDEMNRTSKILQKSKNVWEMQKFKSVIEKQELMKEVSQYTLPMFHKHKTDEHFLQNNFGQIENIKERKVSLAEGKCKPNESIPKYLELPMVSFIIDTAVTAKTDGNINPPQLFDMVVIDDKKVWVGGSRKQLQLFDLQGNIHHTVTIPCTGSYLCVYKKQVVFRDYLHKAVKKISDEDTVVTMFTTGDWKPFGIITAASGDLLVCLRKAHQSKVVRYSSIGTVLQEIQYDSQCQPLYHGAWYIAENVNGDIIVTDFNYRKKQVIAVDRLGIFRYSYSGEETAFYPMGVVTDSVGHVIVTDFSGHKIHLLDIKGQFLRYIIPEGGIKYPRAVCVIDNGEIVVGESVSCLAKGIKFFEG